MTHTNDLRTQEFNGYEFSSMRSDVEKFEFDEMLFAEYQSLGFLKDKKRSCFLPTADTLRFAIKRGKEILGICALNKVFDYTSPFFSYIEPLKLKPNSRVYEFNNIVVLRGFRASTVLASMLYELIQCALDEGAQFVCGVVRYEVLRYFVGLGAIPIDHPPLKILESNHYDDFIIYFDLTTPEAITYIEQHIQRLITRECTMAKIKLGHLKRMRISRLPDLTRVG